MNKFFFSRNALFACCFIILGIFVFGIIRNSHSDAPVRFLPFYGTTEYDTLKNGKAVLIDTNYFHVPCFSFRSQEDRVVTNKFFGGSVYIAGYFTACDSGICKAMSKNLEKVYEQFKGDPEIKFASFTVDLLNDSIPLLRKFAEQHHADANQWLFLTGDKKDLYVLAHDGYLLDVGGDESQFRLTSQFVLVDKEGHIRGYYDGTRDREIEKMIVEINILRETYSYYESHSIKPLL